MRDSRRPMRIFVRYAARVVLLPLVFFLSLVAVGEGAQRATVGVREYAYSGGKWYGWVNGQLGDERDTSRLTVRLKNRANVSTFPLESVGLAGTKVPGGLYGYYQLKIPKEIDPFTVARALTETGAFDYVDFAAFGSSLTTPCDPHFEPYQWGLHKDKLRMEAAWDICKGDSSIVIAIIDSGIDLNHQDLHGSIWHNWAEINGEPGVDDDDWDGHPDSYIDDFYGWCHVTGTCEEVEFTVGHNGVQDTCAHGTAVAGICGAMTNNQIGGECLGMAGVAGPWPDGSGCRLMAVRDGAYIKVDVLAMAYAITYASSAGARVLNISQGYNEFHNPVFDAIYSAVEYDDCVVVCAAGNSGGYESNKQTLRFPASLYWTISVGATLGDDSRWAGYMRGSCIGADPDTILDVMAPGGDDIWTTDITGEGGFSQGDYTSFGGTSAAAPHVAGLAALILSEDPSLHWYEVRDLLRSTADKVPDMGDDVYTHEYGYGRINALRTLMDMEYDAEFVSGDIDSATTWPTSEEFSNVYLEDGFTVSEGATLTILPGTTVFFVANSEAPSEIIVEGRLVADASGGECITFRSLSGEPSPGDWGGISVAKQASVELVNCVVEDAEYGVSLYTRADWSDYPCVIENSEFSNIEVFHIRMEGASQHKPWVMVSPWAYITDCTFDVDCPYCFYCVAPAESVFVSDCRAVGSNSASFGVYVESPEWIPQGFQRGPQLVRTDIVQFATGSGLYLPQRTEVTLSGGELVSNKWGILCQEEASAEVVGDEDEAMIGLCTAGIETHDESQASVTGGSRISNCTRGLYVKDTSSAYVRNAVFSECYLYGVEVTSQAICDLGTELDGGNNSFSSGAECGSYKHVKAKLRYPGLGPVMAEENWWDSDPPDGDCFSAGTVDYDPWLSSDPNEVAAARPIQLVLQGITAGVTQNYPNPFSRATNISYTVPTSGIRTTIEIFDVKGRLVRKLIDAPQDLGRHTAGWDGMDDRGRLVASGIYFFRVEIGNDFEETKKMILGR